MAASRTRPSVTSIAAKLGVSAMSVSVALRGMPGVSAELRAKILSAARELGYTPDPVASEYMAMLRSLRGANGAETIAFINTFSNPSLFDLTPGLSDFIAGAKRQARVFGYNVERFDNASLGAGSRRLAKILKARGVRGVLLGPRWRNEPDIEFPWDEFSVVLVGEAEYGPNLYRVCNHHLHSCSVALRSLEARGYRRVGLALLRGDESRRGFNYRLGMEQFLLSGG